MKKYLTLGALTLAGVASMSTPALAQAATEIEPINNLATSILGVLTGPLARVGAAIAVAFLGWSAFTGRMDKGRAGMIILGIILVFGATTIVDWLDTVA